MAFRVLVINWQDIRHPLAGGAEVHLHEIFGRLARRGWDVTLLASGFRGAPAVDQINGLSVRRVGTRTTFNLVVPFAYAALHRGQGFDVVVDDLNKIPFYSPLFAAEPVAPLVHHFFDRSIFLETWLLPALYVYLAERFVAPVYRNCLFGAVSESTRQDLVRRGIPAQRIMLVPNGVDLQRFTPDESERSPNPLVGYFGRLKRYKSVDHLILAFQRVAESVPDSELVIVGEGDDRPRLERLAGRCGLGNRIRFTGYVSAGEKVQWLRRMWVCVNPSPREGWGLTVTEANACGTPVVAADSPGLRDSVLPGVTGFLYPYGDLQVLSSQVIRLLKDGSLRKQMAENAIEWARQFTWDRAAVCAEEWLRKAITNAKQEE